MKKFLSCLLVVLLLASLTVSAFASEAEKTPSAEKPEEPTIEDVYPVGNPEDEETDALIVLTLDKDKANLSESKREVYEEATEKLMDLDAVVAETEGLEAAIDGREVGVSAMFDISVVEGREDEVGFPLVIKLKIPSPESFVALLQYEDGMFVLLETELEDDILTFTVEHLCPFAIISAADGEFTAEMAEVSLAD